MLESVWRKHNHLILWECKLVQPLWKQGWRFLKKTKHTVAKWSSNLTPGHISRKKTIIQKDACIPAFIAALFTTANTWEQRKCPLTDEWIKKLWYIYKDNKIMPFAVTWIVLEIIILNEVSSLLSLLLIKENAFYLHSVRYLRMLCGNRLHCGFMKQRMFTQSFGTRNKYCSLWWVVSFELHFEFIYIQTNKVVEKVILGFQR